MNNTTTTWILARKRESSSDNIDLRSELESINGVSILLATDSRAQIEATPEGIDRVRATLSASFHIEPVAQRFPTFYELGVT